MKKEQQLPQIEYESLRASAHPQGTTRDPGPLFLLCHPRQLPCHIPSKQDSDSCPQWKGCLSSSQMFAWLRTLSQSHQRTPTSGSLARPGHVPLLKAVTGKGLGHRGWFRSVIVSPLGWGTIPEGWARDKTRMLFIGKKRGRHRADQSIVWAITSFRVYF